MCLTWIFRNISLTITTIITIFFWTFLFNPQHKTTAQLFLTTHTHGITLILILIDYLLSKIPL